jgi:hypothetical protein
VGDGRFWDRGQDLVLLPEVLDAARREVSDRGRTGWQRSPSATSPCYRAMLHPPNVFATISSIDMAGLVDSTVCPANRLRRVGGQRFGVPSGSDGVAPGRLLPGTRCESPQARAGRRRHQVEQRGTQLALDQIDFVNRVGRDDSTHR